jgi:hypothetical protein
MFEILNYSEKAIAVIGDTKSVKDELKQLGGRFNPRLSCGAGWIFPATKREQVEQLLDCPTSDAPVEKKATAKSDDIMMSAALKEEIRQEYAKLKSWDGGEYAMIQLSNAVKLSDGKIIVMRKQRIETHFCFGEHGYDYDEKLDMARNALNDENFFINRNMEFYCELAEGLNKVSDPDGDFHSRIYLKRTTTSGNEKGENIWELSRFLVGSYVFIDEFDKMVNGKSTTWAMLSGEDLELAKKLVATESKRFEKRLRTYLKRYGLSKIHSWTYWADR